MFLGGISNYNYTVLKNMLQVQVNVYTFLIMPNSVKWYINDKQVEQYTSYELLSKTDQTYRYSLIINYTIPANSTVQFSYQANGITHSFDIDLKG